LPLQSDMVHSLKQSQAESHQADRGFRIPVGINLILSLTLAGSAIALRSPYGLAGLAGVNFIYFFLNRSSWLLLWKAARVFFWQSLVLLLLHYLRFSVDGLVPGLRVSCQLFLAFLPGMIFLQGTNRSQLVRVTNRFLSARSAFVLGASLHFLPLMITEVKEIYQVQVLRGSRIHPCDIFKPWCWPDWVSCLIVPCTVQALALAGEIAQAAKIRDFGLCAQRTCWPETENHFKSKRKL